MIEIILILILLVLVFGREAFLTLLGLLVLFAIGAVALLAALAIGGGTVFALYETIGIDGIAATALIVWMGTVLGLKIRSQGLRVVSEEVGNIFLKLLTLFVILLKAVLVTALISAYAIGIFYLFGENAAVIATIALPIVWYALHRWLGLTTEERRALLRKR